MLCAVSFFVVGFVFLIALKDCGCRDIFKLNTLVYQARFITKRRVGINYGDSNKPVQNACPSHWKY